MTNARDLAQTPQPRTFAPRVIQHGGYSTALRQPTSEAAQPCGAPSSSSVTTRPPSVLTLLIMVRDNAVATQAAVRIVYRTLECQRADIDHSASIVLRRCVLTLIEDIICDIDRIYAGCGS